MIPCSRRIVGRRTSGFWRSTKSRTVPPVSLSHPLVERLIGTMRREFLDHVLFWNAHDLERKLGEFQTYYNAARCHASLKGHTPATFVGGHTKTLADLEPRALGLPLQGPRPAPSRRLTTNSRRTGRVDRSPYLFSSSNPGGVSLTESPRSSSVRHTSRGGATLIVKKAVEKTSSKSIELHPEV